LGGLLCGGHQLQTGGSGGGGGSSNERWNIIGAENFPESQLFIFDRYGKLLSQIDPTSLGWDGTLERRPLPETDYCFKYIFKDGKVFPGHFSLKRVTNHLL